ncbi:MAG: ATP-binding protein, partial [Candidatus Desantisbacteria bacterium]
MEKIFESILERAKTYCRDETDFIHLVTALEMAEKLIHLEGGSEGIVIPAIILHDTGWHNFSEDEERKARKVCLRLEDVILNHQHEIEGGIVAQKILSELNYPKKDTDQIIEIIQWHDTRTNAISKEDSLVKDADKLSRYVPKCFDLFCSKLHYTEDEFYDFLNSNLERWFFTDSAKFLAREYLLKRKLKTPNLEFPEGLPNKLYEILIRLEGEVAKKLKVELESLAINAVREKVSDVAKMIKIYLSGREDIDVSGLQGDEEFQAIATQRVGQGGYIGIIDRQTGRIIFHPDKRLINLPPQEIKKEYRPADFLHGFWEWQKRARDGEEFYSHYQGMNTKQEIIDKFQYVIPLDIRNAKWSIVAAADYKDFFKPMDILSKDIVQYVSRTSLQIGKLAKLADKQAKELQEERERLDVTLHSIGDGVIVADTEGKVVLLNKVAEELTGWQEKEAINKSTSEIFYIINEYTRKRCENPVEKVLASGIIIGLANHTALIARDGSERVIADSGAPIYDKDGNIIGVVLVFRDITEKKRIEEKLITAERLAAVAELAAEAVHEIKNPLQVILNGLYLLEQVIPADVPSASQIIPKMNNAVVRVTNFLDDMLHISKPPDLRKSKLNINEMIKKAMDELPAEIFFNIDVQQELAGGLPDILADFKRLKQVVTNLVKNAAEAMGEVSGNRLVVRSEQEGDVIKIIVSDTGKGIPEEDLKHIFDPFFTTKGKGTGLGLAICQRIVEAHDGRIDVTSKMGEGT